MAGTHLVSSRKRTFDSLADHFLPNDYDPADFALKLAHKDVALAVELGRDVGVPMRFIDLTRAELAEALNRGWGDRDSRVSMLLQQERAGVEIEVDRAKLQRRARPRRITCVRPADRDRIPVPVFRNSRKEPCRIPRSIPRR